MNSKEEGDVGGDVGDAQLVKVGGEGRKGEGGGLVGMDEEGTEEDVGDGWLEYPTPMEARELEAVRVDMASRRREEDGGLEREGRLMRWKGLLGGIL